MTGFNKWYPIGYNIVIFCSNYNMIVILKLDIKNSS